MGVVYRAQELLVFRGGERGPELVVGRGVCARWLGSTWGQVKHKGRTKVDILHSLLQPINPIVIFVVRVVQERAVIERVLLESLEELHHPPLLLGARRRRGFDIYLDLLAVEGLRTVAVFLNRSKRLNMRKTHR